jgi:coenzyme F420-reducing hydrogenase delta subunit/ferredoxin
MYDPKIIGFLCTWCSYTGADLAGTARLKMPWNMRAVRVPCSGRVSPELIMRAFEEGADGVLVLGCHIGECHYDTGNHRTAKRIPTLKHLLSFAGLEPERLRLDWVSASEGERFSKIVTQFTETIRELGPLKWRHDPGDLPLIKEEIQIYHHISKIGKEWADQERDEHIQSEIRREASALLESGKVNCVIGYENGSRGRIRPVFLRHQDNTDRLIWNQRCTHNLTTYIPQVLNIEDESPTGSSRVAVVSKPCDTRSINVLIAGHRFDRKQVHVIGINCSGILEGSGYGKTNGEYQNRCIRCTHREPLNSDTNVGIQVAVQPEGNPCPGLVEELDMMSAQRRSEFWLSQFDRCIRCYACRQVCPVCDCPTCLYERDDSLWVGMNIGRFENRTFHLGRAFHLAGRCVGCDECERVCPMNIPISLLNQKLNQEIEADFDFQAGLSPLPSPINTVLDNVEG